MADRFTLIFAAAVTALCGAGLGAILCLCREPMTLPTEQFFHTLIGLMTAGGVTIFALLNAHVLTSTAKRRTRK
jgi:hypothetical protein